MDNNTVNYFKLMCANSMNECSQLLNKIIYLKIEGIKNDKK